MRHTQEEMQSAIVEWQSSGLSKKAFCRDRKIKYQTFHYWYKRLASTTVSGFNEVKLGGYPQGLAFELLFPSGVRMVFDGQPSAAWLRDLVR